MSAPSPVLWKQAVKDAVIRYSLRHNNTKVIERKKLIDEELRNIVQATDSKGVTPEQTLSRVLQELRDEQFIAFQNDNGVYLLRQEPITDLTEDLPADLLEEGVRNEVIVFPDIAEVNVADKRVWARRRAGQRALRHVCLQNYGQQCALCDTGDSSLLVASHIVPWSVSVEDRGKLSNVIALCRCHDSLFERAYIALSDNLDVLKTRKTNSRFLNMILDSTTVFAPPSLHLPNPVYLQQHRKNATTWTKSARSFDVDLT